MVSSMAFKNKEQKRQYEREWYERNKKKIFAKNRKNKDRNADFVYQYLTSHPCIDCGESDPIVLEFDHIRGKKIKAITDMVRCTYSLAVILKEIKKCVVRCANCHRRKTAKQLNWYRHLRE